MIKAQEWVDEKTGLTCKIRQGKLVGYEKE